MDKEEFRRRRAAIKAKSDKLWGDIEEHRTEEKRVINVLHNAESMGSEGQVRWSAEGQRNLSVCHEAHIYIKGWLPFHINVAVTANEMRAGLSVSVCRHWHQTLCKPHPL